MIYGSPLITAYVLVVAGLLGLVMGSFVNCWAWRYLQGESVVSGRSHCTSCGHSLAVRDLIPVISWLSTHGTCRYCGEKVSARYPLTEVITAVAFVAIVAVYGLSLETVELLAFAGILLFLSLTDIDDYLIPNGCIIAAIVVRIAYLGVSYAMGQIDLATIGFYVASAFGMGLVLLIVVLVADKAFGRATMGGGDLKLYFVAGLYFGWQQGLFLVILSCIIGLLFAVLVPTAPLESDDEGGSLPEENKNSESGDDAGSSDSGEGSSKIDKLRSVSTDAADSEDPAGDDESGDPEDVKQESKLRRAFPFGPSIAVACIVTALVGNPIITWYLGLL